MVGDRLRERMPDVPPWREKFSGVFTKGRLAGSNGKSDDVVLLKPMTYMNLSGHSVQKALAFFQLDKSALVVVHDELDLSFGAVRVKSGGGAAGHNGIRSIIEQLGSPDFVRVRIGIGRPTHGTVESYVLADFDPEQRIELPNVIDRAVEAVESIAADGLTAAMNKINPREGTPAKKARAARAG